MFTSKDIREIEFDEVKRGYNQTDVRAFLRKVSEQIEQMERERSGATNQQAGFDSEKAALEEKLMILADKVEEYRKDEDSLRAALLSAQKLGDSIVKEARENAEIIKNEARIKADEIITNAYQRIESEKETLAKLQGEVSKFKNDVLSIYKSHLEVLSMIPETEQPAGRAKPAASSEQPAAEPQAAETEAVLAEATAVFEPARDVSETREPLREADSAFFAPPAPEDGGLFTNFQPLPNLDMNAFEAEMTEEPKNDADVYSAKKNEDAPVSRFGQLDFGDGFSFSSK